MAGRRQWVGAASMLTLVLAAVFATSGASARQVSPTTTPVAKTPIKHVVVIFQENVSFDHYFGTGPQATAPLGGQQGRCGFGPRLPMLLISPCARQNYVDHNLSNQASIINFVEYNWSLAGINGSFDQAQTSIDSTEKVPFDLAGMFDFTHCANPAVQLDPVTGEVSLAGANLAGKDLHGANLSAAELAGANLKGANLKAAFLPAANLAGSDLAAADLTGANLWGANLQGANLAGANLTRARLRNVNLKGAKLGGATTAGATWINATCPDGSASKSDGGTCLGHL